MNSTLIELCAGGIEDVRLAHLCKIPRIELNSGMAVGGLTPSTGLTSLARKLFCGKIISMVRPREGGFCYTDAEFEVMTDDAERMLEAGCDGLAVGFLTADAHVDIERCNSWRRRFPNTTLVFHRAFDVTSDQSLAIRQLIEIGFNRILTSGARPTAIEGAENLRQLGKQSKGQIELLPGGDIRAANVATLLRKTGCTQLHTSGREVALDPSIREDSSIHFGGDPALPPGTFGRTSRAKLTELIHAVRQHDLQSEGRQE